MSTVTISMRGKKRKERNELGTIAEDLRKELTAEMENIRVFSRGTEGNQAVLFSGEKYFFRNNSYASLNVMLTEFDGVQTADIVGSGGGEGLFNISWFANSDLADSAERILQKFGFITVEESR